MNILCVVLVFIGATISTLENLATANSNDKSEGFHWLNYDNASRYSIIDVLNGHNYRDINVVNRTTVIDNLFKLAKYVTQETNYLFVRFAFSGLSYLDQHFSGHDEYYKEFKHFVLSFIDNIYKDLGYEDRLNDKNSIILLRSELNRWACKYGQERCIQIFTEKFQKWRISDNLKIKPNQRAVAYCTGIRYGTKDDWEYLWDQYTNSSSAIEQTEIIQALGCTQDSSLRERYLLNTLKSFRSTSNSTSVFSSVSTSSYDGAVYILDFVQKHHKEITEHYNGTENIASILSTASQGLSTQGAVDQFEHLIKTHQSEFKDILSSLNKSLEIAKYELLWFDNYKNDIVFRIRNYNKDNGNIKKRSHYRLPQDLAPLIYSIHIKPFINASEPPLTFEGEVNITAKVKVKTNTIVLHSTTQIKYENRSVSIEGKPIQIKNFTIDEKYELIKIVVDDKFTVGQKVNIHLLFNGTINDKGRGLYRSWYRTDADERRWLLATDLEPVHARKVFPCFDEPAMKAKFTMKVTVPEKYNAVSNSEKDTIIRHLGNQKIITFKETPKMSTYLVALVVSDFSGVTDYNSHTVWARPNAINQIYYALNIVQPLVQFYEKNLNIPYQLEKLEMVALPDFESGAMENWGLLTFQERNLLYLEIQSTLPSKQAITNVISHEIAHQWFGNMVSPAWWSYTWLNEGFARYFQYLGTATVMTDWSLDPQFVVDHLHTALNEDSSITSHPMTHDVNSPAEIQGMFDTISYAKAGSVIRMVRASFGDEVFFKALSKYLSKQKDDVATPENLFDAFKEEITDVDMKNSIHDIMNSWTTQAGYPVVNISFEQNRLNLKQERFLIDGKDSNTLWKIPITWTSVNEMNFNNTKPKHWLNKAIDSIDLPNNKADLFIFNIRQSGYYRINYDDAYWERIIEFLKFKDFHKIDEINRAAIIDDLMNFAKSGYVDYNIALSATQYLVNETSYVPLKAFFTGLTYLRRQFEGRDAYGAFKRYVAGIIAPIYKRLGFTDSYKDSHTTKLLKIQLRKWACEMEVGDCETKATRVFTEFFGDYVPADYRSVSYCVIAKKNNFKFWKNLKRLYSKSDYAANKAIILQSMACTTDPTFLEELLQMAISEELEVRKEDSTSVFSYVIEASLEGANAVMNFISKNYDKMVKYYGGNSEVNNIINTLGRRVTTEDLYLKYIELFSSAKSVADKEWGWAERYIPLMHKWMEVNYPDKNYRLPKLYSPLKYNVTISPNMEKGNFAFSGKVQIEMRRLQLTSRIVVNSNELNIKKPVKVYSSKGNLIIGEELKVLGEHVLNKESEMVTVFMEKYIHNKTIILDIEYTGILNDNMVGFYRSHYEDSNGKIHWLATTQFQATYARMAFPCFDEPAYKANFTINIERPKSYTALSNMPSVNVAPSNVPDRVWETFHETVPMSTYTVAFVVSDFKPVRDENTNVRVWSTPNMALSGDYAQTAAQRILGYLYQKTNIEYALPKLDLVAVPDFSMGAMENWGLATFRESAIQYDDKVTSAKFKDYVTTVIAHELTHMWFGNLVTCAWWEYTWLNEGFAEYMQWIISDMFQSSHKFNDRFVVDELQQALLEDDYVTSHPINKPVSTSSQIGDVFDTVTYGKGSSLLRMVEHSFGTDVFWKAINRYLLQHKYNTTTPKDLWRALDEVIDETRTNADEGISVEQVMDTWTNEAGYPILYATRNQQVVHLRQYRFCYTCYYDSRNVLFWIPISIATSSAPNFARTSPIKWMGKEETYISIGNSKWFLLNVQQSGFYRVKYDSGSWYSLINALYQENHSNIHVTNRAQLVDDAFNLARARVMSYVEAFNCIDYLRNETEYLPWKAFFNGMNFLLQRSEGQDDNVTSVIKSYILHLTSKIYISLDFEDSIDDDHLRQLSRELILTWRCKAEDKNCVEKAKQLYTNFKLNMAIGLSNPISPNVRAAVYCTAMRDASISDWDFMWEQYLKADFASEKKTILEALGCSTNEKILRSYINRAINGSYTSDIRKQDVDIVLTSIYNAGEAGVDVMLVYLLTEYKTLYEHYGEWNSVRNLFSKLASQISTSQQLKTLKIVIDSCKQCMPEISLELNKTIDTATTNYKWYTKNANKIFNRLNSTVSCWDARLNAAVTLNNFSIISVTIFTIISYVLSH